MTELTMKDADTLVLVSRDWRDRVLDEVKALRSTCEALEEKVSALSDHETCGCSYDSPMDVCLHHAPKLLKVTKERDTLAAQNVAMREALKRIEKTGKIPNGFIPFTSVIASESLALTPTESVEKVRRKDAVAERIINACHCYKTPAPVVRYVLESTSLSKEWDASWKEIREAVEAARKEGVE